MTQLQDIKAFVRGTTRLARAFLLFAVLSAVLVPITLLQHDLYIWWVIYPMHLAGMVLMFMLFWALGRQNLSAMFGASSYVSAGPLPLVYWPLLGFSLFYLLYIFFAHASTSPQGVASRSTFDLRIPASFYLFLNLGGLGFAHSVGKRKRADQAA